MKDKLLMRRIVLLALFLVLLATPRAADAQLVLYYEADFSKDGPIDRIFWKYETGFVRNQEKQYYQPANVFVQNGILVLEAREEHVANRKYVPGHSNWTLGTPSAEYTSGSVVFRPPLQYGRVEVTARVPSGFGVWPAIWLVAGTPRYGYGEIDIMEAIGSKTPGISYATIHYGQSWNNKVQKGSETRVENFEGYWHTYTLDWFPNLVSIRIDGREVLAIDPEDAKKGGYDPLRQPMQLIINLALGGKWSGPVDPAYLPARLEVSAVKIWRWQDDGVQ